MSLEVTLIPLALVVINVIDKEYYNSWIKNKRVKKPTAYSRIEEFENDLKQIDYKYSVQHDTIRICSKSKGAYYYFSKIKGEWSLSFSEYDSQTDVASFLASLAQVSKGKVTPELPIFSKTKNNANVIPVINEMPSLEDRHVAFYPTIFNDKLMLLNVLKKQGIEYKICGDDIEFEKDGTHCTFMQDDSQKYILRTIGNISEEELFRTIQELDIVYKKDVQKKAYDSVMSKIGDYNMVLGNEVRLEDDTIVLTLNVE